MRRSTIRLAFVCAGLTLATGGCARDPAPSPGPGPQRSKAAFDAARERCGVTVADTAAVQTCMRAQGWMYRHPWE